MIGNKHVNCKVSKEYPIKLLQERGNRVCVMVGPLNPYMLTPASLNRFRKLQQDICTWLKDHNIEYVPVPDLPTEMYADASHPLDKGYDLIADTLLQSPVFTPYINHGAALCSDKK